MTRGSAAPTYRPTRLLAPDVVGPQLELDGERATVTVPMRGSTAGMTQYSLAQPMGLAVTLPRARSLLAPGVHTIDRGGLRTIWIRERVGGGVQVRFLFADPPPRPRALEADDDAIKLRLEVPRVP